MTLVMGMQRPGSTILIPFNTFDSNDPSDSVIISGFALADIGIYKGTSMDERGSTTGVVLLDSDGINLDGAVGIHGFTIDLSSDATADFYEAGQKYYVTVGPITVDGATTVSFIAATFEIGYSDAILNTTIATLASQVSFTIDAGPADDDALNGYKALIHDKASAVQIATGYVSDYDETTGTLTVTLKADPGIFTMAAGDNVSFFMPANVQAVAGTIQTAGDIIARLPAALVSGRIDASVDATGMESGAVDQIWDEAMVASTGAPAITGSIREFMEWWATLSRNVINQTATTTTVRNDADDGDISTSTVSDNGTTFVRGEFST